MLGQPSGSTGPTGVADRGLFRLAFDQAPVAAAVTDLELRFTAVNDVFCRMTGYSGDELATMTLAHVSHPEEIERDRLAVQRLNAGEIDLYQREKRYARKDGGILWGEQVVRPLVDDDGRLVAHLVVIEDVTERKRAELASRESEEHFRSLVENLSDVFIRYDLDLRFTYVSPVAERVLGLHPGDLIGKTHREAGLPDHLCEAFDGALRRALEAGRIVQLEFTIQAPNGEISAEARVYPEVDAWGEPSSVVTVVRDITERKLADEALRASETRYRIAIENTYDWEWWEAPDGNFVYSSPGCEAVTGYGPEEFTKGPERLLAITHPADRDRLHDHLIADITGTAGPSSIEFRIVARNGRERVVEHLCRPVWGDDGRCLGRRASNRDVTERRRSEEALRALKAMRDRAERTAHLGSWRWDIVARQASCSPEMYRLYDLDAEEFDGDLSAVLESRVHPEDRRVARDAMDAAIDFGGPATMECRVAHRDGSEHIVFTEAVVETDDEGRQVALVGYCQDVTDQRRAEATLREAELRARSLFEQSPVSIWEEDFSAVREWLSAPERAEVTDWQAYFAGHPEAVVTCAGLVRVVDVNQASLELFGAASRAELFGDLDTCFDDASREAFGAEIATLAGGGTRFEAEVPVIRRDGKRRIVDLRLNVVRGHEESLDRVLVSFVDVTALREAEARVRRTGGP